MVVADTVADLLRQADVAFTCVRSVRPGAVHVQVRALTPRGRRQRQAAVLAALDSKRQREYWHLLPVSRLYQPRHEAAHLKLGPVRFLLAARRLAPSFAAWISVSDVGQDWQDDQGRTWYEHIADPAHPDHCPPGHLYLS
ncbi:hypothetical protein ABH935_007007 [Catenulispora sp. GAS73]|uniref:hypothetical protein n=1 Tax=Catenulispora sp. GAS73 TaxID=3156269 RepID=UPI003511C203